MSACNRSLNYLACPGLRLECLPPVVAIRDVSRAALDRGVSIVPHGCQEIQLPLVAGVENGEMLEYYPLEVDPLRAELFLPSLVLGPDGFVDVPPTPGIGFDLNMDLLSRYRV